MLHFILQVHLFSTEVTGDAKIGLGTIGALPVSIIVWVIGLALGGTTGYAINPARDLGPRIMHSILKRQQRLGIRMDSSYCTVNRAGISSTTILPCITIILFNFIKSKNEKIYKNWITRTSIYILRSDR